MFAIAYNDLETGTGYNPQRVIDTLRLFIDLVDVLGREDERWTSGSWLLRIISEYHRHTVTGEDIEVFLWALEILGADFRKSLDEGAFNSFMTWCLESESGTQRLLNLCNNVIDARNSIDGYSLLHTEVVEGDPVLLLNMGANPNLVGFDPDYSPYRETPISLSMYRAETFVTLQKAFKISRANLRTTFDQALEQYPFQYSHWTKDALVELFSEDLDLEPILYDQLYVCPYCSHSGMFMVQLYWMRMLESIRSRERSQSIQDTVKIMLSTSSQIAEVNRVDDERPGPKINDAHLSDHEDESVPVQSDDEVTGRLSTYDDVPVDGGDMCLFCWQEWRETGVKPPLDGSKCLRCDQSLSSLECWGKSDYDELYCVNCAAKQEHADLVMEQQQKRHPTPEVDSEDEEDHYSPYLIHT